MRLLISSASFPRLSLSSSPWDLELEPLLCSFDLRRRSPGFVQALAGIPPHSWWGQGTGCHRDLPHTFPRAGA